MQENLLKRQCYAPAAKKIKELRCEAAAKMCPLHVHMLTYTHTHTECGYVTLKSNAECSI